MSFQINSIIVFVLVNAVKCLCVGLVILIATRSGCFGQLPDFNVQLLDDKNGIQMANAAKLIRDRDGFLWILSPRHIQRFDGQNVRRIEAEGESLIDIASDSAGTVWITSDNSVWKYRTGYRSLRNVPTSGLDIAPLNKLGKLQITPDHHIWVNAGRGLYQYDPRTDSFRYQALPGLEGHHYYRRIFSKKDYQLYLADVTTVFSYDTRGQRVRQLPFASVRSVVPVTDDIVWASNSRMETFELNFATGSVRQIAAHSRENPTGIPLTELISITPLGPESKLVNTTKGCYLYNARSGAFSRAVLYQSGKPLPNDENYSDFLDRDGTKWILCQEGVLFFRPLAHTIGWLNGFPGAYAGLGNNVKAITEDGAGRIWLGTSRGIAVLDVRNGKVTPVNPGNQGSNHFAEVKGLVFDGRNLIVARSGALPQILDPVRRSFSDLVYPEGTMGEALRAKLRGEVIATIVKMPSGDHLIVGELVCYKVERGSYRISELAVAGADKLIQTMARDGKGRYWMGTYQGLVVTDSIFQNAAADSDFLPGKLVGAILMQNDSTAWCGSVGLYEVVRSGSGFKKKKIFPELANQRISMIHRDKAGRIWIGSDDGLYLLNRNAAKLQWFDFRDNIQNKPFNINSVLESANGRMYVGGLNGLNYFDPGLLKYREEKLNVIIAAVKVNQDDSLLTETPAPLRLNWTQNSVEIQYLTPYFRNPEKLMYRYRLTGLDDNWVDNARNSRVRFTSLPPGQYTFSVAASLDGLQWSETATPLSFVILVPWWKTWWFISAVVLVATALGYWLFRQRVGAIRRQTALREHMAELEMRALRAQMNPHFIFNCLNSINRYIVKSDNATASLYLTRFAKLIRLILDNSNSKNVLLSNELEALKLYIEMERIRFDNKFDYRIMVDEEVNTDSIEVPSLIIQPYVENAIWHGLLHKEASGSLWVKIRMLDDNRLECVVEDNGVGRGKAAEFRSKSATGKKSLGMKLTEDRIAVLNQYARTSASVEILDLEDENRRASGTRVVVTFPV
ncbi:histidine kinase [Dyadobacter sp. CY261]|uniref:sensor histidine kinase n=1 Tax=Dyadobacter sp. CY261 TaxID=2907203 RepID=UPI001F3346FA|nr:sensor histidine kinase [Dyadobacter sp. CY261]MCF0070165.1 histidine kinase [Dyadobacter sp. CY261]